MEHLDGAADNEKRMGDESAPFPVLFLLGFLSFLDTDYIHRFSQVGSLLYLLKAYNARIVDEIYHINYSQVDFLVTNNFLI